MENKSEHVLLHGGDYNPEQWLHMPDILKTDVAYLKKAHCNEVTMGVFSWAALEPEEGNYQFGWLQERMEAMQANGIHVILATPSGARPKWLADKYPEVLRVSETGERNYFGFRHNHCYTSPVYREKVRKINMELARRFGNNPNVLMWHISNEYGGACFCELCQQKFREYVKAKYKTIEKLNLAWNTSFWSHTYQNFEQIEAPSKRGETMLHGLSLEWKRFVTAQTRDFLDWEVKALRDGGSEKPVTVNMMYDYDGLDYRELAKSVDVISWDTYPTWHKEQESVTALDCGMQHDIFRSMKKDRPFLLMESCPGATNWQPVSKLKKPGMAVLSGLQAVAHGSDSVLYFQIRQSRGASEKFHGAVIDHYGGSDTRIFREVTETGLALERLKEVAGSVCRSEAAVFYDWTNRWAVNGAEGPRNKGMYYKECVQKVYNGLRRQGINVDFVGLEDSLDGYRLLAIPMGYVMTAEFTEKVREFVKNGGILVTTYWTGIVDEHDLCHLGGWPYNLMDVLGLRAEEIDGLYDWEENEMTVASAGRQLGFSEQGYSCTHLCELVKLQGAKALLSYRNDFYKGKAAVTSHEFGKGNAYHVCCDAEEAFYTELFRVLAKKHGFQNRELAYIPEGVEVTERDSEDSRYLFVQNFHHESVEVVVTDPFWQTLYDTGCQDNGEGRRTLGGFQTLVLKKNQTDETGGDNRTLSEKHPLPGYHHWRR